jgi:hypothetical protein
VHVLRVRVDDVMQATQANLKWVAECNAVSLYLRLFFFTHDIDVRVQLTFNCKLNMKITDKRPNGYNYFNSASGHCPEGRVGP